MSSSTRALLLTLAITTLHANAAPSTLSRRLLAGLENIGVSQACQDTITNLLSAPASDCLNIPGTVAVLSTVEGSSWIPPISDWLSDFCSAPTCTDEALASTIQTVATACAPELSSIGLTQDTIVQYATQYYPIAKQALCLRDTSNDNDLCVVSTLENVQTAFGENLTPDSIQTHYEQLLDNDFALARQLACTPCASAGFALVRPMLPTDFLGTIDSFVGDQCGVDFVSPPSGNGTINVVTGTAAALAASATAPGGSAAFSNKVPMWLGSALAIAGFFTFAL